VHVCLAGIAKDDSWRADLFPGAGALRLQRPVDDAISSKTPEMLLLL
jgi:hypothetical protein